MMILNPTPEVVVAKHDGATYAFKPGESRDIFNNYAATHILGRWGKYGLVNITFNEKIAKKYVDHEIYSHAQSIKGVEAYLAGLEEKVEYFKTFDDECGDKKTVQRHKIAKDGEKVKKKLADGYKALEKLEAVSETELMAEKANKLLEQAAKLQKEAEQIGVKPDGNKSSRSKNTNSNRAARS